MKQNIQKFLMYGIIAVTLAILGALYIWAPVCDGLLELANGNMVRMRCFYTSKVATILAILLLILAIQSLITKKTNPIMIMAIGIMLIAITFESVIGIGICMKDTMACHDTAPWLRYGGAIITLIGVSLAFQKKDISLTENQGPSIPS